MLGRVVNDIPGRVFDNLRDDLFFEYLLQIFRNSLSVQFYILQKVTAGFL